MTLSLVAAAGLFKISTAFAFMLKFDGGVETPAALYASAPDGHLVRVLEAGASAPNGGTISEIGVPALAPDGSLIFGAEVRRRDEVRWQIFRADPGFGEAARIEPALSDSTMPPGCRPVLKTDPYAVAGSDGSIVFVAVDEYGSAALFRYVKGRIDCEMRVGDRTGHPEHALHLVAERAPGDVREQVTVRDLGLDRLVFGTRLHVGTALLEVAGPCQPCERMNEIRPGLLDTLVGRRGRFVRVVQAGSFAVGDPFRIEPPA